MTVIWVNENQPFRTGRELQLDVPPGPVTITRPVEQDTAGNYRIWFSPVPAEPATGKAAIPDDPVDHPRHYNASPSGVECIDVIEHLSFNTGSAIKYLWRAGLKGDAVEDLKKARWYADREIARLESMRARAARRDQGMTARPPDDEPDHGEQRGQDHPVRPEHGISLLSAAITFRSVRWITTLVSYGILTR